MNAAEPPMEPRATQAPAGLQGDLIDLRDLLRTFKIYRWRMLSLALLSGLAAGLWALSLPKTYQSTATVLIESKEQRPIPVAETYDPGLGRGEYYGTQYEIFRSRDLVVATSEKLKLADNPGLKQEFQTETGSRFVQVDWRQWLPYLLPADDVELSEQEKKIRESEALIAHVTKNLVIEPIRNTQLVKLHFESRSPQLAADFVNTLADLYLESGRQTRLEATRRTSSWLTERIEEVRKQLEKSEQALQRFREQEKVVKVGGTRTLSEEELTDFSQRMREAQKKKTELASAYAKVREAGNDEARLKNISALLLDPAVQKANENLLEAQEIVKQLEQRYGPKHPQMTVARARLAASQSAYRELLKNAAQGIKASYEIALENERAMSQLVQGSRERIRGLDRKEYEQGLLEREVTSNRQLYELFSNRYKETDTASEYEKFDARIVDRAPIPIRVYKPEVPKIAAIGLAVGVLFAFFLALLSHILNDEIQSVEELEKLSRLPVLGVLPKAIGSEARNNIIQHFIKNPNTPLGEGIRSIRASLQLLDVDKKYKCLMVTSSVPQEGKTSLSGTLALSFGSLQRTLLVETDLRLPALSKAFGIAAEQPGLTDLLAGNVTLDQAIVQYPGSHNVFILPAGSRTQYPGEIISSASFRKLTEVLSSQFERVIYDTPPCHAASDALVLSDLVDAVLFVVKSDSTSIRSVKNALKQLRNAKAPLIGTLINQVDMRRNPYYQDGYYCAYDYYNKS